ncbi:hypothetical protein ABH912_000469 [Pseudomonas sp. BT76 TE3572]|uniref:hypothetical protein n=1 Tax=Pseudomonas sp. BT76 TE3572 TaxID=3349325 RepID=UPI003D2495C5
MQSILDPGLRVSEQQRSVSHLSALLPDAEGSENAMLLDRAFTTTKMLILFGGIPHTMLN